MNNELTDDDIFGSAILSAETSAVQVDMQARRLLAEGKSAWAADYSALAAQHAADAGHGRNRAAAHVARLAAVRAA